MIGRELTAHLLADIKANPGCSSIDLRHKYGAGNGGRMDLVSIALKKMADTGKVNRVCIVPGNRKHGYLYFTGSEAPSSAAPMKKYDTPVDGFKIAILLCELQAAMSADSGYAKACRDCAVAIRKAAPPGGEL